MIGEVGGMNGRERSYEEIAILHLSNIYNLPWRENGRLFPTKRLGLSHYFEANFHSKFTHDYNIVAIYFVFMSNQSSLSFLLFHKISYCNEMSEKN